jgi:hypothetical protein
MELLQFGSINCHKFHNLRVIWTAINPSDDESNYDVEEIDPAQLDRFHVLVDVPYAVSKAYFVQKYGEEIGLGSTEWWNSLPAEAKDKVSPRRLDYILDCFSKGGDINDFLPDGINTKHLLTHINSGSIRKVLAELYRDRDESETAEKMDDPNFLDVAIDMILKDGNYVNYFIPFLSSERLSVLISKLNANKLKKLLSNIPSSDSFIDNIESILAADNINGAKRKALIAWQSVNVPLVPALKNTDNVRDAELVAISARAFSVNTYHRLLDIKNAMNIIIKEKKSISKTEASLFYNIVLTGFMRSQGTTCNTMSKGKSLTAAMRACENVYPLKKFIKDGGNKIFKNDKMYDTTVRKLINYKVVASSVLY